MKEQAKALLKQLADRSGYVVRRKVAPEHADFSPALHALVERVGPYTQTSPERVHALTTAVEYVLRKEIPGDFVECGVWRGGSMMAVALTLARHGVADRELWLYDTYEGMPAATEEDVDYAGVSMYNPAAGSAGGPPPGTDLDSVRAALSGTGYPAERMHFVKGPVEETIPGEAPESIALLRLDTDWYASTRHELEHLYPRLERAGVLIIDDYGHFQGARQAVDEFFADDPILLNRIDYTARLAVKLG
jgi:O-methyltransferase